MVKFGFIGTGWTDIGQIKAFQKSGLSAQATFSRNSEKAKGLADKYEIPEIYTDWKKLIESPNVDFISIVVPTFLHADIIKYARKFNKPFICEAPFSSVKEIKDLMAGQQNPEIIDYELRFTPHFCRLKKLIDNKEIGKIQSFKFEYHSDFALDPELKWNWAHDKASGGGYLNLVGGHFIDIANFLFGQYVDIIESKFNICQKELPDGNNKFRKVTADDEAMLKLKYPGNLIGEISISQMRLTNEEKLCFEIIGEKGVLKIENNELLLNKSSRIQKISLGYEDLFLGEDNNLFTIGSYFLGRKIKELLEAKKTFEAPGLEEALHCQEIIEKAYENWLVNVETKSSI